MTSRSGRKIITILSKKSFREQRSGDHVYLEFWVDDVYTGIFTKVSHSMSKGAEIGDSLLAIMARQLKLNKQQFLDLIDCQMSAENYLDFVWPMIKKK